MKLKLDENLGRRGVDLLREAGHDVTTVAEQELLGTPDKEIISKCHTEGRCLVTLDLDFANPLLFAPLDYAGIAVLRLPSKPTHTDLLNAIRTLITGLTRETIDGKLWIVQPERIREYQSEDTTE